MNVKELIADCISGGWDFMVLDEDMTPEIQKMLDCAGYTREYHPEWTATTCIASELAREEGGLPC